MARVWYIGNAERRIIFGKEFGKFNGWSVNESVFTAGQLLQLEADSGFLLGQTGIRAMPFRADSVNGPDAYLAEMQRIAADIPGRLSEEALNAAYAPRIGVYQSTLLGELMQKLRSGQPVKIVVRGDSTTYGHDTTSADRVAAPGGTLPDGSQHSFTRSPVPYPAAMQGYLNETYPGNLVTVENQGYSGDWVQRGFDRWTSNVGADATIVSYGINDATASGVPVDIRGDISDYVAGLERMILRDLAWGSAVILMTPTRQRGVSGNTSVDAYRNALQEMAQSYGVPLIDGEQLLLNASYDCWSDGNHLTTKGNAVMGARLASIFIGEGPQSPRIIDGGAKMLPRVNPDGVVLNGTAVGQSSGYGTPRDDAAMNLGSAVGFDGGSVASLDGTATWSFYMESPDTVIVPYSYVNGLSGETGVSITYELDFGVEQGQNFHPESLEVGLSGNGTRAPSSVVHGPLSSGVGSSFMRDPKTSNVYLRVATPGWHSLRAKYHRTVVQSVAVTHMIEAIPYRSFKTAKESLTTESFYSALSAAHIAVPSSYDESADIAVTKIKWSDLMRAMGGKDWTTFYYAAPVVKMTVRTYGIGLVEYSFLCTQRLDQSGADIPQRGVDAPAASETSGAIPFVKKLGSTSTVSGGNLPENSTSGRELAYVSYEAATQSIVFTWRTTNSSGGEAKNLKKNFVLTFSLY